MALSVISFKSAEGSPSESEYGRVVELVDSLDSGSSVHCGRAGSSPASPTKKHIRKDVLFYLLRIGKWLSVMPIAGFSVF